MDDFSDLEDVDKRPRGLGFYLGVGLVAAVVLGLGGFFAYTRMDDYYRTPSKALYGNVHTEQGGFDVSAGAMMSRTPPSRRVVPSRGAPPPAGASLSGAMGASGVAARPATVPRSVSGMAASTQDAGVQPRVADMAPDAGIQRNANPAAPRLALSATVVEEARALMSKRRYRQAAQKLEAAGAATGKPGHLLAMCYEKMAESALDRSVLNKVMVYSQKAIALDSKLPSPWFFVGYVLHSRHKNAAARVKFQRYLELCPKCRYSTWARKYQQ